MSSENVPVEKDNFWIYVGAGLAAVVVLVLVFKNMHNEAIPEKAYQETQAQVESQLKKAK